MRNHYTTPESPNAWQTALLMAIIALATLFYLGHSMVSTTQKYKLRSAHTVVMPR